MKKQISLKQTLINIAIGWLLLLVAIYLISIFVNLASFSMERANLIDDQLALGYQNHIAERFEQVIQLEQEYIKSNWIARVVTSVPTFGKFMFGMICFMLSYLSTSILYFNIKRAYKKFEHYAVQC